MHFVFLNQYYPPDAAPTGVMLAGVVEEMIQQGHDVTVICAEGGYADKVISDQCSVFSEDGEDDAGGKSDAGVPARREELAVSGGQLAVGEDETEALGEPDSPPTANSQRPTDVSQPVILRIGATKFGRGNFVGKLLDYTSYYLGVSLKLLTLKQCPDCTIALTTPPYLSVLARGISKLRGGHHAHWVMDLYPDVMVAHGMLREGGIVHRILMSIARWGFGGSRCAAVVTLGPDMAERLRAHVIPGRRIEWVPLWGSGGVKSDQSSVDDQYGGGEEAALRLRRERGWRDDELVVMYSGNMGRGHRFGEIFEAAKLLAVGNGCGRLSSSGEPLAEADSAGSVKTTQTRFVFYGGGNRKGEVSEFAAKHPECRMEVYDYAPAARLREHLQGADIHLVSLEMNWTGTMVPSKLQGIFEVGRPAIFIGSREASIAKWILESGGGWVVEPGDVQGLVAAIDEGGDPNVRSVRAKAAAVYAVENFSKETNISRLVKLFRNERG